MQPRKLKAAALFVAIFCFPLMFADYMINFLVRKCDNLQIGKVSTILDMRADAQVVAFGASNGEVAFLPSLIREKSGKTALNFCVDGTSPLQYQDLVRAFLNETRNAETIVLCLPPVGLPYTEQPTALNRYLAWRHNEFISSNALYQHSPEMFRSRWVPLYGYTLYDATFYKAAADGAANIVGQPMFGDFNTSLGANPVDLAWGENNTLLDLPDTIHVESDPRVMEVISKLASDAAERQKNFIVLVMPAERDAFLRFADYQKYINALINAVENNGVVIDVNATGQFKDKNYYYNYTHLNMQGAALFSSWFAEVIQEKTAELR